MASGRAHAVVLSVTVLGAVLSPLLGDPPRDGFPLSNYPMFSRPRTDNSARVRHVVAISRDERHRPVGPDLVGTDEVMQAHQTIKVAVDRGQAAELCEMVAARVAADPEWNDIEALQVRTDVYDVIAYFDGDRRPMRTRVYATCSVPEEAPR